LKAGNKRYLSEKLEPLLDNEGRVRAGSKLSDTENGLVNACLDYEKYNPKGKKLPLVWYIMAEVFFRNSNLEKAREQYLRIISKYPTEKIAVDATKNIIASYNYEGKYNMVEEWSKKLLASGSLAESGKDVSEIKGLLTGSLFKSAQKLEAENKLDEAATEYIKLSEQYPKSSYSDAALYNSGLIYEKLGKVDKAINSYQSMLTKYPKTRHAANAAYRIAVNYEQQLDFNGAADKYESITGKYPSSSVATDSYYNAARLRRANNQFNKAAENLIQYHNRVKDQGEKSISLLQAAKLYERNGNDKKALQIYSMYITNNTRDMDGVMECFISRGHLFDKNRKKTQALNEYKKAWSYYKGSGSPEGISGHYAAEARYRIVESVVAVYDSVKIKSTSVKNMKRIYEKKEKLLKQIAEEFLEVVKLGSPEWSVASLYRIGYAFQGFADFLYDAPVPRELDTEELKQEYSSQLQMQAIPYEDKAIEYYEKAIAESARLKVVNDWTRMARQRMAMLKPDQYAVQKDELSLVSPSMDIRDTGFVGR
ncbi:MAG: tetratricopeptide repeat protein, partial [Oligoflexia bacterium]|nr:tetratricopeptide repeat protein [Oligoflexia bacterium]